ncbi:hypothetical protein ACQLQ8_002429, partial [Staphylococcus pseudintermedius]
KTYTEKFIAKIDREKTITLLILSLRTLNIDKFSRHKYVFSFYFFTLQNIKIAGGTKQQSIIDKDITVLPFSKLYHNNYCCLGAKSV